MKRNRMTLILLVSLLAMSAGSVFGQQVDIDMSSGLLGVSKDETVIVRVVETDRFAKATKVTVHFLDATDRTIARRNGELKPGRALQVEVPGKLFVRGARGSVRVVISLALADAQVNKPHAGVEFYDPDLGFRVAGSCGPGAQPSGPQFIKDCDSFIVDLTIPN